MTDGLLVHGGLTGERLLGPIPVTLVCSREAGTSTYLATEPRTKPYGVVGYGRDATLALLDLRIVLEDYYDVLTHSLQHGGLSRSLADLLDLLRQIVRPA
jgi:hypothetical protein